MELLGAVVVEVLAPVELLGAGVVVVLAPVELLGEGVVVARNGLDDKKTCLSLISLIM